MRQKPINTSTTTYGVGTLETWSYPAKPAVPYSTMSSSQVNQSYISTVRTPSFTANIKTAQRNGLLLAPLKFYVKETITRPLMGNQTIRHHDGKLHQQNTNRDLPGVSLIYTGEPVVDTIVSRAKNRNVIDFLNEVKDQKVNVVQALAERAQTARLIGDAASKTVLALSLIRRGDLIAAASAVGLATVSKRQATRHRKLHKGIKTNADIDQVMSHGILAIQYGIRPLIQDVVGAAELIAQKQSHELIGRVSKRTTARESGGASAPSRAYNGGLWSGTATWEIDVTVKTGCTFTRGSEVTHTLKQMGFSNPLQLAWELLPWSFVIDWFLPIGSYLSTLDATNGLKFQSGWRSTKVTYRRYETRSAVPDPNTYHLYQVTGNGSTSTTYAEFSREVLSTFPSPKLPSFKNPVSLEHALNGIALLAGFKKSVYSR